MGHLPKNLAYRCCLEFVSSLCLEYDQLIFIDFGCTLYMLGENGTRPLPLHSHILCKAFLWEAAKVLPNGLFQCADGAYRGEIWREFFSA